MKVALIRNDALGIWMSVFCVRYDIEHATSEVHNAQRVFKSLMRGTRVNEIGQCELVNLAQTLKRLAIDKLPGLPVQGNEIVDWVTKLVLPFHPVRHMIRPFSPHLGRADIATIGNIASGIRAHARGFPHELPIRWVVSGISGIRLNPDRIYFISYSTQIRSAPRRLGFYLEHKENICRLCQYPFCCTKALTYPLNQSRRRAPAIKPRRSERGITVAITPQSGMECRPRSGVGSAPAATRHAPRGLRPGGRSDGLFRRQDGHALAGARGPGCAGGEGGGCNSRGPSPHRP